MIISTVRNVMHVLPSGKYASYIPMNRFGKGKQGPVVQVAQLINGQWHGTPAQHYARTLLGTDEPRYSGAPMVAGRDRLWIDGGAKWGLSVEDTAAHLAFAAGVLAWEQHAAFRAAENMPDDE